MSTLTAPLNTTARRALAPTAVDRALLVLSRVLARTAEARMQRRATRRLDDEVRRVARESGRSPMAEAEFALRVR
ncbi:hypothetical protein [Microbacterium trichothecenolyticum]|uniref:Uncharacterized protein n=1 Tax=Microbacterium trichothecenolyticum TaxID=69370 RepID=A0ABU0TQV5_MICTR|nr:hypothetical protein [Microbacterium trichothecenolyticum]MDQ1122030.1 hypothetical protein [Microbacterium trichothecenolyticum]